MVIFRDAKRDAGHAAACNASVCMTLQSLVELVRRDWLQQLCLANIEACKKHARNTDDKLFVVAGTRRRRSSYVVAAAVQYLQLPVNCRSVTF